MNEPPRWRHLGYCSRRLLSTLLPWKGYPAPPKAWRSCCLTPKHTKSLTEVPLEAQKKTQGPIVLNVGFPQPKSMGSLCQKCSRLGSDSPNDAYANASLSHSSVTGTPLPLKQHQASTKMSPSFWNHTQPIMWNLSLNLKTN